MNCGLRFFLFLFAFAIAASICRAGDIVEEVFEQTYPIEPTGKFSVRNDEGSIRIYGAETDRIKLLAIKKAYSSDRLRQIQVNVSTTGGGVSIDTRYPPKPKWGLSDRSGTVDYVIVLPWRCEIERVEMINGEMLIDGMRGKEVHAHLENGRFFGHNCFTDLHVSVGNGGLDVGYDWWEDHKFSLDADIADGNAHTFIPGAARFHLFAASPNGHVFSDFTNKKDRQSGGVTKMDTEIGGSSDVDIQVRAGDGSIKIGEAFKI
jgi:hypothetical protein